MDLASRAFLITHPLFCSMVCINTKSSLHCNSVMQNFLSNALSVVQKAEYTVYENP